MRKLLIVLVMALLVPVLAAPDILYAPADPSYAPFVAALNDSGLFGNIDYYNAQTGTPSVADLQNYALVITYAHYGYASAVDFGNNIADYIDLGGSCVTTTFAHTSGWGLGGRFMNDASYSPFPLASYSNPPVDMTDPASHPIMDGITTINNITWHEFVTTRDGATRLASLTDTYHFAAINAGETAVAVNLFPDQATGGWTGQGYDMIINAMAYLINANKPNLTEVEADGMTVFFHFDKDTNEPVINASNIDDVFALSRVIAGFGSIHAASLTPSPLSDPSWLSGDGSLGDAVWTDAQTLEVTLSSSGGAPTVEIGDTVTVDGSSVQLADVNNPCDSEVAITGAFNIVSTTWGSLKTLE